MSALLALALSVGLAEPAHAVSDQERSAARDLAAQGVTAYDAGKYEKALDLFTRASEIVKVPSVLLYVARSAAKLGKLIRAREAYNTILRQELRADAPAAFQEARRNAEAELPEIDKRMPRVTVTVSGAGNVDYKVLVDGEEMNRALLNVPQPLDPGEHRFEVAGDVEGTPVSKNLTEGASETVALEVRAVSGLAGAVTARPGDTGAKSGKRVPTLAYVAFGVGAVGLGVGAFMGVRYLSKHRDANDHFDECNPRRCTPDEKSDIESLDKAASTAGIVSIAGLAVGAAGAGVGIYLLVRAPKHEDAPAVGLRVVPGGASVVGRF